MNPLNKKVVNQKNRDFVKDVMKLFVGTSAARAISLLMSPIIGRLFLPESFGEYSVYLSYVGIAALFFTLRYELLFFSLTTNRNIIAIFKLINWAIVGFSSISMLVLIVVWSQKPFSGVYFLGPLAALVGAQYIVFSNLFLKKKLFGAYSRAAFVSAASVPIMQCGSYYLGFQSEGLILGHLFAQIITALFLYRFASVFICYPSSKSSRTNALKLARSNTDFPFKTLPQKYLSQFHSLFFVIILALYFDDVLVGVIAMAIKLLSIPVSLILQSVASVALQRLSYLRNAREQLSFIFKLQMRLALLSILPFIIFYWFAEELAVLALGPNWVGIGHYIRLLIPFYFLQTVFHPIINMFYVNKWINQVLLAELFRALLMLAALFIAFSNFEIEGVTTLYTAACFIGYCVLSITLVRTVKKHSDH